MAGQFDLKWQPVQASDSSKLLAASQEATEAYDKAIKDQIKVFDTMFNNAQQHKMNEVQQALNALSLEDYNTPDARAKFDEIVANASKEIGGFNAANQLTMDTIWDKRGDVLSDRETGKLNLESLGLAVGDKRDADTITNFGQTRAAMRAEIDRVSKLPQSPERDALLGQLELGLADYETAFKTSHPDLWIRGDNATVNATISQQEAQGKVVDTQNSLYDSMVNGMYPQFSAYAEARKEVLDRYADTDSIKDEKEKAAKIAERDSALAKVSTQFKDVDELLKDPRMMASLNKKWQQELDALANDSLKREEILAKIRALDDQSAVAQQNANTNRLKAETEAAVAAAEIAGNATAASESQRNKATETNRAAAIASASNVGISEEAAKSMLGTDGRVDNTKAVTVLNTIGKALQEDYNLGAPKGASDHMAWRASNAAKPYVSDFNKRVKDNPKLAEGFAEMSKGLSGVDTTLLYMGIATLPLSEVGLIVDKWYRRGTTRQDAATSLINQSRKTWKDSYMLDATSVMSKRIDWVASQQGMTSQAWMQANRKNLSHALMFQSANLISSQASPIGGDNWSKTSSTPTSSNGSGNRKTGDIARNRVVNGSGIMSGR